MLSKKPLAFLLSMILAAPFAQAQTTKPDQLDLSLEELMNLVVTSVSKKAQTLAETAAAAYVIKAEDIRRSGATNIPEALRLAPGVQVAAIGHNRWSVSIRGFNSRFSNKLLVLVDGRAIYSPVFSGVFWEHNDIPLDNIERIEVIRGPGGSLWGANAVNGIINIITYPAQSTQGGLVSAAVGDEVRANALARYGWALDDETYVRLHANTKSIDAGQAVAGGSGPDDWKIKQAGFRLDATRAGDSYTLQGNISDYQAGDRITAFSAAPPYATTLNTDGSGQTAHLLGKWEHPTDTGSRSIQAFVDHSDTDLGVGRYHNNTFDLEYLQQATGDTHDLVWGLGYRVSKDQVDATTHVFFTDPRKTFSLYSAFIQDEITLVPKRWRLTLGSRFEHNDFTGFEAQPNIRLLWTPSQQDSVWAAASRAVRTPSRGERASTAFVSPPVFTPTKLPVMVVPPLATVGNPNMDSEKLAALDVGWRRQWSPKLNTEVTAFYYRYAGLRGVLPPGPTTLPLFSGSSPYLPLDLTNTIGADAYGLELAVEWQPLSNWRLQANTSLFEIRARDALPGASGGEFLGATPSHQVSLRSSLDISSQWQWDVWLRHVAKLDGGTTGFDAVPAYTSLNMRLAWKPQPKLEISLVGQNLLNAAHPEFVMTNILSTPVLIQRGVYLKTDWKF